MWTFLGLFLAIETLTDRPAFCQASVRLETTTPLSSSHQNGGMAVRNIAKQTPPDSRRIGTIDESTRWQFVSHESIAIDTAIIRLGDVIRPLEPDLVAWQRLAGSIIGLMPADGGDAKVSRDRLADLISRAAATPGRIKIYGPETIVVRRLAPSATRSATRTTTSTLARTQYVESEPAPERASIDYSTGDYLPGDYLSGNVPTSDVPAAPNTVPEMPRIDYAQLERMQQYVLAMIRNQHREIYISYDLKIEFDPEQLVALSDAQGVRHLAFLQEVPAWSHTMTDPFPIDVRVHCRAVGEDLQGVARLTLRPYPAVVTARTSLRRGQRVSLGDLQYVPYSNEGISLPQDTVERPQDIVDLEVIGLVRGGVPLSQAAFAAPRVIRRGDLLEVQVGGGGVRVTTGAKALGDGAVDDLIEIETLSPKRRLLAKVVHATLVEIVTQAPRVRSEPATSLSSGENP